MYEFADTLPTNVLNSELKIIEKFDFFDFDSREGGWWLVSRSAPSPMEKEILEVIPYSQGVLDFSMINNDRYFNNRDVTYQLIYVGADYPTRKGLENGLKDKLMTKGIGVINDTHDANLHWLGKCKSVSVDDDQKNQKLTATIVFDCYPYAISDLQEGNDIWDEFNFDSDIAQRTKYDIDGSQTINLINIGAHTADVILIVDGNITVSGEFGNVNLATGTYVDTIVVLTQGANEIRLIGKGSVEFKWFKEVMI